MSGTLYVSDLDRTLLNSEVEVSDRSEEIINGLISVGMDFTFATARSWISAYDKVAGLDLELPGCVYNGCFIVDPADGEFLVSKTFEKSESDEILETFLDGGIYPLVYSFIDGKEKVSWVGGEENDGVKGYLRFREGDKRLRRVDGSGGLSDGEPFYFSAIDSREKLEGVMPFFEENDFFSYHFREDLNIDGFYWLEVKHREGDKAWSVERIKEMTGCDRVVSFGDNVNDIPMFSVSNECYAVENGDPKVKEAATGVIPDSDEDGVAVWLEENAVF